MQRATPSNLCACWLEFSWPIWCAATIVVVALHGYCNHNGAGREGISLVCSNNGCCRDAMLLQPQRRRLVEAPQWCAATIVAVVVQCYCNIMVARRATRAPCNLVERRSTQHAVKRRAAQNHLAFARWIWQEKIVYTSRFVRVILAQGPC